MLWLNKDRIPQGKWPFLRTTYQVLEQLEELLTETVDLTEGEKNILITGGLEAYRQAILRRALDLAQAAITSWNAGQIIGSVVCARALLETLATFHSFLSQAQVKADRAEWDNIGELLDSYAFSTSKKSRKTLPSLSQMVKKFIEHADADAGVFWNQICEEAHPNGKRIMSFAGNVQNHQFEMTSPELNDERFFPAIYNCLYSCCWLFTAMLDFDILLEHIRNGGPLDENHHLIHERALIDKAAAEVLNED